jgi:transcriptional regulator with XRE-family HTH domain
MRLKMTQEDLAFESGLSRTYAGDVERGEKEPSIETIARIAAALKMTGAELLAKAQI